LLAQVYVELTGGRQIGLGLGLGLVAEAGNVAVSDAALPVTVREARPSRLHQPLPEELERHRAFIARLVNPLWARIDGAG
jgi:DNA polymerase-3 subunit epsilon